MLNEMDNLSKIIMDLNKQNKDLSDYILELKEVIKDAKRIITKHAQDGRGVVTWKKNIVKLKIVEKAPKQTSPTDRRKRTGKDHHSFKTHCKNGHLFAGENLMIESDGQRKCRICVRENAKRTRERALKRKANENSEWDF